MTPLHIERGAYSLLEWRTPAGAARPPDHRHRQTDEGLYVARGRLATRIDGEHAAYEEGSFIRITRGRWHTFWNPGEEAATFAELAAGLAARPSPAEAQALREKLFARYEVQMRGADAAERASHDPEHGRRRCE